jgi:outer membrane protein assembly factor BamB
MGCVKRHDWRNLSMMKVSGLLLLWLFWLSSSGVVEAADWLTFGYDSQRSGWVFDEKILSTQNVLNLELRWKVRVKNEPKALHALTVPLVASNLGTPQGIKTLVYVAGTSNVLFALDSKNGSLIWSKEFKSHAVPHYEVYWQCPQSITATPVIDKKNGTIYVITAEGVLYGLDLGTGEIKFGPVQFVTPFSKNWSLNLVDGVLYTSVSQSCSGDLLGIYAMDVREPTRPVTRHLLTDLGGGAGSWGRGGVTIGKNGRIYAATGDGTFDPFTQQYANSVLAVSLGDLRLLDYFIPLNWRDVNRYDLDISCTSPVWFADRDYNLLAVGGKEGVVYLMDAEALGNKDHQTPLFVTPRLANDEETFAGKGIWGGLSAWKDEEGQTWLYVPVWGEVSNKAPKFPLANGANPHGSIMAFKVLRDRNTQKPTLEPAWVSGDFNVPEPVVIANGVVFGLSNGEDIRQNKEGGKIDITTIDWTKFKLLTIKERRANPNRAILYALDAKTGKTLYNSDVSIDTWTHFSGLAVANGCVYAVDSSSQTYCFGLKGK